MAARGSYFVGLFALLHACIGCVGGQRTPGPRPGSVDVSKSISPEKHQIPPKVGPLAPAHGQEESDVVSAGSPASPAPVSTVASPERTQRHISLQECLCLALERGRIGDFFDRAGSDRRTSVTLANRSAVQGSSSDNVRVLALDPAILATEIEQSLARFDVFWRVLTSWNRVDAPGNLLIDSVPRVGVLNQQKDAIELRSELLKPLPTGGVAGMALRGDAVRSLQGGASTAINPAFQPGMDFLFEQPLWQGAGVFINQVRDIFPTSVKQPVPSRSAPVGLAPGILIARIGYQQSRIELEARLHELVFAVEEAYWELYCAYWDLYTRDAGLQLSQVAWQTAKERMEAKFGGVADVAQAEEQFHFFRTQRLESLGRGPAGRPGVLEAERRLRYLVGLPPDDGTRLIPLDHPRHDFVEPDWNSTVAFAQGRRPELRHLHRDIEAAELQIFRADDLAKPDLRFFAKYGLNGVGQTFREGFQGLGRSPFSDWQTGLQLEVPLGFRAAHSELTRSRLQLEQRYLLLKDQENKVWNSLQRAYQDVVQFHSEVKIRRSQREAAALHVQARFQGIQRDKETVDLLLRAQRIWADALRDEYLAVCRFNIALADFERQKGTILDYHSIRFTDGPAALGAHANASEFIRGVDRARSGRLFGRPFTTSGKGNGQVETPAIVEEPDRVVLPSSGAPNPSVVPPTADAQMPAVTPPLSTSSAPVSPPGPISAMPILENTEASFEAYLTRSGLQINPVLTPNNRPRLGAPQ